MATETMTPRHPDPARALWPPECGQASDRPGDRRHPARAVLPARVARADRTNPAARFSRAFPGARVEVSELNGPGPHLDCLRSAHPMLVVALEEIGGHLETRLQPGGPSSAGCLAPNRMSLIPPDTPVWEYARDFSYIRRITIEFDPAALPGQTFDDLDGRPRLMFSNPNLLALAGMLAKNCTAPQAGDDRFGESLVLVIAGGLLRAGQAAGETCRSGLAPWQLRRVTDCMKDNASVPLPDLAVLVGLSPSYLSRAFKVSTGVTPRRWQLMEKVQRAQQIMITTNDPLADIALASGFADQSHFTNAFRTFTGTTPRAWRRERPPFRPASGAARVPGPRA
ncbi:helix-turn-helix domain-containing protein [bacterium]|nr:helix-turn-helix domain-containing protein [bacterium]